MLSYDFVGNRGLALERFSRILIAADDESNARAAAEAGIGLARKSGAASAMIGVVQESTRWPKSLAKVISPASLQEKMIQHRTDQLRELLAELNADDCDLSCVGGRPFVEIISAALEKQADLVVYGATPAREGKGLRTPTEWHLMRRCPVPVWIVRGRQPLPAVIGAAVDLTDPIDFNHRVLTIAALVAANLGASLTVFSAWSLYGELALRDSAFIKIDAKKVDAMVIAERDNAVGEQQQLRAWFEQQDLLASGEASWVLQKSSPETGILDFVVESDVDLLVMGTIGRVGVPGLFIGNTAERVLSAIECEVLTVKPEAFSTSVAS